jgi:GT2 family glycosyltransferase
MASVSVIVVNWNRAEMLRACLESLVRQEGIVFEVVVVDNGSADGSLDVVREFRDSRRLDLQIVANRENRGFCEANNQGIAAARGALIGLLNNDAEAESGWLAALAAAFDRPEIGMAASKILVYEEPSRIDKCGHLIFPDGQNRGRGSGEIDSGQYDRREEALWPDGCAAMYRREMFAEIGGFDEDFFAYGDDAELGLRARLAGWECVYVPAAVVRHRRGSTLGKYSMKRIELIERNRVLLAAKLFPWRLLALNPFFYALRLCAGAAAALRGRGEIGKFEGAGGKLAVARAMIRADFQALRMLPRMLAKRRSVKRRLTSKQVTRLLKQYRIPLATLTEQA